MTIVHICSDGLFLRNAQQMTPLRDWVYQQRRTGLTEHDVAEHIKRYPVEVAEGTNIAHLMESLHEYAWLAEPYVTVDTLTHIQQVVSSATLTCKYQPVIIQGENISGPDPLTWKGIAYSQLNLVPAGVLSFGILCRTLLTHVAPLV